MRLPRSSGTPFSIRDVSVAIAITLLALLPQGAAAATQQLVGSPAKVRFGSVAVGQSETQVIVLTNTGSTSTTVSSIALGGSDFQVSGVTLPFSVAAGQSVALNLTFTPTTKGWTGWTEGKISFTGKASNPTVDLWFAGSGVNDELITAAPSNLSFGQTAVGSSATKPIVLTNPRAHTETVQGIQTIGKDFSVSGPTMPATLGPGQSITLNVTYSPQSAGPSGGSIFVTGPSLNLPLTGTGSSIGLLSISPATLNFGKVLIGDTGTEPAVFTATGGSVTISSAASSSSQFTLPGVTFPLTIAAGASVQLNVEFTPQKAGAASGKLSFSSNASDPQDSEPVAGTGTAPMVSLGWSASTSSVQGYNVYRGTVAGTYTKINSALDPNTTYTDTTVAAGKTYYYAATAVNSSGQESSYSAPVEVSVP